LNSNTRHFGSFTFISVLSCKTKWSIPWFDTGDGRIGRVLKTKVDGLLVIWPQNHWDGFLQFGLKTVAMVFSGLASQLVVTDFSCLTSKLMARVSRFRPQNRHLQFGDLDIKITVIFSWFVPQNQADFSLSVVP
jgi:hypothetical protein